MGTPAVAGLRLQSRVNAGAEITVSWHLLQPVGHLRLLLGHLDVIDTWKGTVHMVLGGEGTSVPSNELFFDPP